MLESHIIGAALQLDEQWNGFASTVCILAVVKNKAEPHKEIYPYVIQEPTLYGLRSTPQQLGLDKVFWVPKTSGIVTWL